MKNQRAFDLITVQNTMVDEKFSFDKLSFFQSTTKKETNTECIAFKIFSSKIIRRYKLRFNENLTHGEDNIFIYEFMKRTDKHYIQEQVVYLYRKRQSSATRGKNLENKRRLYSSQILQAYFYHNELTNFDENNVFEKEEILLRRNLYLQRALITMVFYETSKEIIELKLKELAFNNLYPMRFSYIDAPKGWKQKAYTFIKTHLGNKQFFMFTWRINKLFRGRRQ